MKTLVLFDSNWGNTEMIACAIAAAIGMGTNAVRVGSEEAKRAENIELLVIGSPVIRGRPTKQMQEYLKAITRKVNSKLKIATFDTRMTLEYAKKFGFAADRVADQLKQAGYRIISEPKGFIVTGQKGPLAEGELERANRWGKELSKLK